MNTAPHEIAASVSAPVVISVLRIAAGELEEHEIGRRVVEEGREPAREPEIGGVVGLPSGLVTSATSGANAPFMPARSMASTGTMQMKMPAKSFATSWIGPQEKPFASRSAGA